MAERLSLSLEEFPRKFQLAISRLKAPRRGRRQYSTASQKNTIQAVGQYLAAMKNAGLELELSPDGLSAFIDNLDERKIRNSTRLSYLAGVQAIAKEMKYPAAQRRLILEDCEIYREAMFREVPTKVRKLAANPITLRDVALAAVKWRKEAQQANSIGKRRTYFQRSGILALLSLTPVRISDANGLIVGKHVIRSEQGWVLILPSGKSGYRHNGPLHHSLTPYLDDLLINGTGISVQMAYHHRTGTPLFATDTNGHLSSRTLAYSFKVATGHSPHIVRTLVHDAMAKHGSYGADLARVLCGQISVEVAKSYEVHAQRYRAQKAQEILAHIQANTLPGKVKDPNILTAITKLNRRVHSKAASVVPRCPAAPPPWSKPPSPGLPRPRQGSSRTSG